MRQKRIEVRKKKHGCEVGDAQIRERQILKMKFYYRPCSIKITFKGQLKFFCF